MTTNLVIRETTPEDSAQVLALYPLAFPDEELRPVVATLLGEGTQVLSLAGFDGNALVAHVLFTFCGVDRQDRTGALLGPLGVTPLFQRQGLGSSLVRTGLERMQAMGVRQVFVLGDPGYYQRFGFAPERNVRTPCPIPEEWADAWQSMTLAMRAPLAAGQLAVPAPWMEPGLWAG